MTKILLTGAGGFVGGAILRRLLSQGFEVVTLGRAEHAPHADVIHHRLDLLAVGPASLRALAPAGGTLIHAAWYTNHADYLVAEVNRDWTEASKHLFEAFRGAGGGRMVGLGTCIEYDLADGRCTEERTPLRPTTLYGACKQALSEQLLAMTDTVWARVFFVYGPGDRAGRLVPDLIVRARGGQPVTVRHGGLRRDYIHIDDLAAQIVALAFSDLVGPVNTGTGHAVALADIATAVAHAAGQPHLAEANDRIDPNQPRLIEADMARFRRAIGPLPARSLREGLLPLIAPAVQ